MTTINDLPPLLTAGWISTALDEALRTSVTVRSIGAHRLGGHGEQGMTGEVYRVFPHYERARPELPASVIAKFSAREPQTRGLIDSLGHYLREHRFYAELAHQVPLRRPACYYNHYDETTGSAALLLGDVGWARAGKTIAGSSVDDVRRALIELARLHAAWWQHPDLTAMSWLQLRSLASPEATIDAFQRAWPAFKTKLHIPMTPRVNAYGQEIADALALTLPLFRSAPLTLVHNDAQGDNLFFDDDNHEAIFIDWQMVTCARGVVDVAEIIRGQLAPALCRPVEPHLLGVYHDALINNGIVGYPLHTCLADYQLATALAPARLVCAVGLTQALQRHPGAFWDARFERYLQNSA